MTKILKPPKLIYKINVKELKDNSTIKIPLKNDFIKIKVVIIQEYILQAPL